MPTARAARVDWPIVRGDDETLVVVFPAGIDLTGRTFTSQVRTTDDFASDPEDARLLATGACSVDGQSVVVALTAQQTTTIGAHVPGVWFSIRETITLDGFTTTVVKGRVVRSTSATEIG